MTDNQDEKQKARDAYYYVLGYTQAVGDAMKREVEQMLEGEQNGTNANK